MSEKLVVKIFSAVSVATMIVLWLFTTFQTQSMAAKVEERIERQKDKILTMDEKLDKISEDVSYIRGRLERDDKN